MLEPRVDAHQAHSFHLCKQLADMRAACHALSKPIGPTASGQAAKRQTSSFVGHLHHFVSGEAAATQAAIHPRRLHCAGFQDHPGQWRCVESQDEDEDCASLLLSFLLGYKCL